MKSIRVTEGDYVDALFNDRKITAKVTQVDNKAIHAVNEKDRQHKAEKVILSIHDILMNYGPDPHHKAVEVYRFSKVHPIWGDVHFFRRKDEEELNVLKAGLGKIGKALEKRGLLGFLPIEIDVRPPKGKYAGTYKFRPSKTEDVVDVMTLRFKDADSKVMPYVIAHEAGHGVWFRLVPKSMQIRWMRLYHSYLNLTEITEQDLEEVRANFMAEPMPLKAYAKSLEEPFNDVFKKAMEWIVDNHSVSLRNLDTMVRNDSDVGIEFINSLWPSYTMLKSDHEIVISEYATKSVEEFFAEAFAYHLTGISLPSKVQALLDKTLQACAGK